MMKRTGIVHWLMACSLSLSVLLMTGCQEEAGPAEKAGREVDKALDKVNDGIKELTK